MKKALFLMAVIILWGGVSHAPEDRPGTPTYLAPVAEQWKMAGIVYEGGDGSSKEKAVVIKGAPNTAAGVRAESDWIRKNHPGWKKREQSLMSDGNRYYDRIEYTTPQGETKTIYFDITYFFGKW